MKIRFAVLALLVPGAALPLRAQVPPPTVSSLTPPAITAGAPLPVTFTITGQNLHPPNTSTAIYLLGPSQPEGPTLQIDSTTDTEIAATLLTPPATGGGYTLEVVVTFAAGGLSTGVPLTVNEPVAELTGANQTATEGVPFSFQLTNPGGTPPLTWQFETAAPGWVNLSSSGLLTGTAPAGAGMTTLPIQVSDQFGSMAIYGLTLYVQPPTLTITAPANLPVATRSQPYSYQFTVAGGGGPYYWSHEGYLPPGISFDSQTGLLSGTPTQTGTFSFWLGVESSVGSYGQGSFTLQVIERPPLSIDTADVPPAHAGVFYSFQFIASGGLAPLTFSGTAPAGLTLNSSGSLFGTPTTQGEEPIQVTVRDAAGQAVSQSYTLKVGPPVFRITTDALQNARLGSVYDVTLASTGGAAPVKWALKSGALPDGISLDPATGTLSGTPAKGGLFRMEFQATDAQNVTASRTLSILVIVPPITITTASLAPGYLGRPYSATLTAEGGQPPLSWSLTGLLPGGLSLDSAGVISGTPEVKGTFAFTLTAADASGQKASRAYQIAVDNPPLTITTPALSGATAGGPYNGSVTAEGGTGIYTWTLVAGALPAGMSLNASTGAITGAPALPGEFTLVLEVKDSAGAVDQRTYNLKVAPPVLAASLETDNPAAGQQGMAKVVIARYPVTVTGQMTMIFTPDAGYSDDPAVQFASGGRTAPLSIAAGSTNFAVPIQAGTTPGTIRITASFQAAGEDITPSPAPEKVIRIEKSQPVISSITVTRNTGGFTVTVTGFATARDITTATFRLGATAGSTLQGSEFTVPVGQAFSGWFGSDASKPFGGQFKYSQPFTVTGDANAVTSVTVTLANSAGASQPVSATF